MYESNHLKSKCALDKHISFKLLTSHVSCITTSTDSVTALTFPKKYITFLSRDIFCLDLFVQTCVGQIPNYSVLIYTDEIQLNG